MKTPVTRQRLRDHLHYSWWKYALLISIAAMGWNIIFTSTAYRAPQEKKVILYVYGYANEAELTAYLEGVRAAELPDMEDMTPLISAPDDTYGAMILMTHFAAAEGDLYLLPKEFYQGYSSESSFVALEELPEVAQLIEENPVVMERAWRKSVESGERHIYGVPMSLLPGLNDYVMGTSSEYYLCVAGNSYNEDNTMLLLRIIIRDMRATPTDLAE